jgi:hypothetical protein
VTFSAPSLALMLLALVGFLALAWEQRRGAVTAQRAITWLALLAALAFVAHVGFVRRDDAGALVVQAPPPHYHELFHYYLGTRYFGALGYDGLYDAAVLADFEDTPEHFVPQRAMRDLATNRVVPRSDAVAKADAIHAAFGPELWAEFKQDVAVFRAATPDDWRARGPVIDHGYNGTPLVTVLLGALALAAEPFFDTAQYLGLVSLLDPYLLALAAAAIAGLEGAALGLAYLFFAFANPLNEYGFTGGAYLRVDYLLALTAAWVALRRGWLGACGALLAVATGLRLFPLVFYACLLLRDLAGKDRGARLRANRSLHAGFVATGFAILAATSFVPTPDGRNPWLACAENTRIHTSVPSANQVALSALFAYAPSKDRLTFGRDAAALEPTPAGEERFDWIVATEALLAARRIPRALCALALIAVALASLRRVSPAETLFPALLGVFSILPVSHYYWALLALVPLATRSGSGAASALALACCAFVVAVWPGWFDRHIDLRFASISAALLAFLLAALLLSARGARRSAALVAGVACVTLAGAGCHQPEKAPGLEHLPIDGDRYASKTFGFSIEKPADWVFLPVTSMKQDGDERAADRWARWEHLEKPALTPLISIAPHADAKPGVDPMVRVYVVPVSPSESPRGIEMLTQTKPIEVVGTYAYSRSGNAGFQVGPATPVTVAGLEGGGVTMRYQLGAEGEALQPAEERLWHVRRGEEYWYFSQLGPDPLPAETVAKLEAILATARLDPDLPDDPDPD